MWECEVLLWNRCLCYLLKGQHFHVGIGHRYPNYETKKGAQFHDLNNTALNKSVGYTTVIPPPKKRGQNKTFSWKSCTRDTPSKLRNDDITTSAEEEEQRMRRSNTDNSEPPEIVCSLCHAQTWQDLIWSGCTHNRTNKQTKKKTQRKNNQRILPQITLI